MSTDDRQWSVKYRPRTVDDLLATDAIKATLNGIIEKPNSVSTILITGPSGSGKTTAARILATTLAKAKPDQPCPDIIEKNLGDERGINDARQIAADMRYLPTTPGAKKVFILDEIQELTAQSASALLKPLEEPPAHVLCILCTDQPEKLKASVNNRSIGIKFDLPSVKDLKRMLMRVLKTEKTMKGRSVKEKAKLCRIVAEASGRVPRAALQLLQTAAMADGKYAKLTDLITESVLKSPVIEINHAATKILLALVLAAGGRDTRKPMLDAIAQHDGLQLLRRVVATTTGVLIESQTERRQPDAYLFMRAARERNVDLDLDDLSIIFRNITEAQAKASTFLVDAKAVLMAACLSSYTDLQAHAHNKRAHGEREGAKKALPRPDKGG